MNRPDFERSDTFSSLHDPADDDSLVDAADYYAILNLPRTASNLDVKTAYKRLCMLFHPDKHGGESKELAESRFHGIQRAYEVLNDTNKRHIYDKYGAEGLDSAWEVTTPLSKDELLKEYERRAQLKKELDAQKRAVSGGEIQVALDATRLFSPPTISRKKRTGLASILDADRAPEVAHALVLHSWETAINDRNSITIKGTVISKNGLGQATMLISGRHIVSPTLWGELSTAVGEKAALNMKVVKNFGDDVFCTVNTSVKTFRRLPPTTLLLGRRIATNTTGYISFTPDWRNIWGARGKSTCSIGVNYRDEEVFYGVELFAGANNSQIKLHQTRQAGPFKLRTELAAGMSEVTISLGGDKRIDEKSRIGLAIECGTTSGVTLRLKLARMGQRLTVPILCSEDLDLKIAALVFGVPLVSYLAFDNLFLKSWREKKREEHLKKIRQDNAELLEKRRKEGLAAVVLLSESIEKRIEAETPDGLIILSALYGKLPASSLDSVRLLSPDGLHELISNVRAGFQALLSPAGPVAAQEYIDVTIPVQSLVNSGQLHIAGGYSKSQIIGFYDPCFGERKQLRITYQFQGKVHQVTVKDKAAVDAPLRGKSTA
ncbi:hypothetical protein HDV03_000696 [Kappamyces sp. JEL0829]|nr:hypothetical protein HDV03_000696 [Kappamyces sp. JEL0829]